MMIFYLHLLYMGVILLVSYLYNSLITYMQAQDQA